MKILIISAVLAICEVSVDKSAAWNRHYNNNVWRWSPFNGKCYCQMKSHGPCKDTSKHQTEASWNITNRKDTYHGLSKKKDVSPTAFNKQTSYISLPRIKNGKNIVDNEGSYHPSEDPRSIALKGRSHVKGSKNFINQQASTYLSPPRYSGSNAHSNNRWHNGWLHTGDRMHLVNKQGTNFLSQKNPRPKAFEDKSHAKSRVNVINKGNSYFSPLHKEQSYSNILSNRPYGKSKTPVFKEDTSFNYVPLQKPRPNRVFNQPGYSSWSHDKGGLGLNIIDGESSYYSHLHGPRKNVFDKRPHVGVTNGITNQKDSYNFLPFKEKVLRPNAYTNQLPHSGWPVTPSVASYMNHGGANMVVNESGVFYISPQKCDCSSNATSKPNGLHVGNGIYSGGTHFPFYSRPKRPYPTSIVVNSTGVFYNYPPPNCSCLPILSGSRSYAKTGMNTLNREKFYHFSPVQKEAVYPNAHSHTISENNCPYFILTVKNLCALKNVTWSRYIWPSRKGGSGINTKSQENSYSVPSLQQGGPFLDAHGHKLARSNWPYGPKDVNIVNREGSDFSRPQNHRLNAFSNKLPYKVRSWPRVGQGTM